MKISAALIVKNEEENLPRLLKSITGKFDEIVVVDTGSTDRTIQIAKEYGCKVYEKEWNGFADARNYAISKCSGDWIWHFDADFELEEEEYKKFLQILRALSMSNVKALTIYVKNYNMQGVVGGVSSQSFIHRNENEVYWEGNIHETINVKAPLQIPIYINHYGYQDGTILIQKAERNLELIKKDLDIAREKSDTEELFKKLFYLFQSYALLMRRNYELQDFEEYLNEFLQLRKKYENNLRYRFFSNYTLHYIANIFYIKQDSEQAQAYIKLALESGFEHPDLLFLQTQILYENGDTKKAAEVFLQCLDRLHAFDKDRTDAGVVDNIENIWRFLETEAINIYQAEDYEYVYKLWKESFSPYYGVILLSLAKLYHPKRYSKLYKKMEKLYQNSERMLVYLLQMDKKNLSLAKTIYNLNPKNGLANSLLGQYFYENKNFPMALKYFSNIMTKEILIDIFPQFIDTLKHSGYENEAKKLLDSLKK